MSYTQRTPQTETSKLAREVARLRTQVPYQNELLRNRYEDQANREKNKVVELERRHLQQQVDDYKAYANAEIEKAWRETDHWKEQVKIIYELLEEQTRIAKDALARLVQYEERKPMTEVIKPAKPKHKKGLSAAQRRHYEEG